jgi:hypothetical protein
MDQPQKLAPLARGIRIPPPLAVVRIVLWRVDIGVHAARSAEFEERFALSHGPQGTEKSLDNAAPLKRSARRHLKHNLSHGDDAHKFFLP